MYWKQTPNQSDYFSKNKMLLLPWWKWYNVINLPPGSWLITSGNGVILGAQCWFLLLADLAFSGGYSLVILGEWESMLLRPCLTSILATTYTFSWTYYAMIEMSMKRNWLVFIEWVILSNWLLKSSSVEVISWWKFTWNTNIFMFFAIQKGLSTYLFFKISSSPIFPSCFF